MKILVISTRMPYPMVSGGKIRFFFILKALAEKHNVTLVSFYGSKTEEKYFGIYDSLGIKLVPIYNHAIDRPVRIKGIIASLTSGLPLTVGKYWDKRMSDAIAEHIAGMDVIHCEHIHMFQFIFNKYGIAKVLDAHNVETQIAERYWKCESNLFKKVILYWNSCAMHRYEERVCKSSDLVLSVSPQDQHIFKERLGSKCVRLLENGVDIDYFKPTAPVHGEEIKKLAFVGAMDWLPNRDGIKYFVVNILPLIRKEFPNIQLDIVGKDPSLDIRNLSIVPGVRITGTVDDVRPFVRTSQVVIVPLRFGGGSRLKILEAFSMKKPVVSTTLGCEGINCANERELLIADNPNDFAASVIRLLYEKNLCRTLTENARHLAVSTYSWNTICRNLCLYYDGLTLK